MIRVNDIVLHLPSNLFYKCENKKHERWMNMSGFYVKVNDPLLVPKGYFNKVL